MFTITKYFMMLMVYLALIVYICSNVIAADYNVGVYYFPGWAIKSGATPKNPWDNIKPFPELEPILGWYPEGNKQIAEKQIQWINDYGVDFIVYDWYWSKTNSVGFGHALRSYLIADNKDKVKFSILWANHSDVPENLNQFISMVDYWIKNYFNKKQFLIIDGKPVVFIYSPEILRDNAKKFGKSTKDLFDISRNMAKIAGFNGVYYIACTQAVDYWVNDYIPKNGYDAISGYNYHRGYSGTYEKGGFSTNYSELASGYKQSWEWILENSPLPYFVPISAGWSKKPWGSHTPHDESISDPSSFKKHLKDAKSMLDRYPDKTMKTVVICAWNEFGEGSYIEPTKKWQFQYLQAIKDVFNK